MRFLTTVAILGALTLTAPVSVNAFERGDLGSTTRMASALARSADRVQARAHSQSRRFRGSERRMLVALDRFADSAHRFGTLLESYFKSPGEVRRTLALLNEDSELVERSIRRARPMASVLNDWDNCAAQLNLINARFESRSRDHARSRGDRDGRYHDVGGVRYPRTGNRYFRDGSWIEITTTPTVVDDSNWYTHEGTRYRRSGNRYYRGGSWMDITAAPVVVDDPSWYVYEGTRYKRSGNAYYRNGRWVQIPSTRESTAGSVLRTLLNQ